MFRGLYVLLILDFGTVSAMVLTGDFKSPKIPHGVPAPIQKSLQTVAHYVCFFFLLSSKDLAAKNNSAFKDVLTS